MNSSATSSSAGAASLLVVEPNGGKTRVEIGSVPFRIGRQASSDLIVRDSRISRTHAQIVLENGEYVLEDANSRHGVYVNGERIQRRALKSSDRIEFGVPDSWQLIFLRDGAELTRLLEHFPETESAAATATLPVGGNLAKLRAILQVARALQTAFSMEDVLAAVVDAALSIAGAERGFLLIREGDELRVRVARTRQGAPLSESDLRVPRRIILRALEQRRDLLSMNFDPAGEEGIRPEHSVADLELRSVVCVPLVRIQAGSGEDTRMVSAAGETVGALYMDSRAGAADLAGGNRELLQTLALEASTALENARLLEEERGKQRIEEELRLARAIQQSLLPRALPAEGWFGACGSSIASEQVGGDYFDVIPVHKTAFAALVADVSGKGVGSALLASYLQGAFLAISDRSEFMEERMRRINQFLNERTGGEKYATIFYGLVERAGKLRYINAGHCSPMLVSTDGTLQYLESNAVPVGLIEDTSFPVDERELSPGDKIAIYSDGVTEAQSPAGEFFGRKRLREIVSSHAGATCSVLHGAIREAVTSFTAGAAQADDMTLLVLEYRPQV